MDSELEAKIGYSFRNKDFLKIALTHTSYYYKYPDRAIAHNEKAEWFGDRLLAVVMAKFLFLKYRDKTEGYLAQQFAYITSKEVLYQVALDIELYKYIRTVDISDLKENKNILSDALEALIAAIYLDAESTFTPETIILKLFEPYVEKGSNKEIIAAFNPKSVLQEWVQKNKLPVPEYIDKGQEGEDHSPKFFVVVKIEGYDEVAGEGLTKKDAQKDAATNFITRYKLYD